MTGKVKKVPGYFAAVQSNERLKKSASAGAKGLDLRTPGMQTPAPPIHHKDDGAINGRHEPEQHVDEVYPDGVLHARDAAVAFCVFRDVHFAEDAEESHVEDEY